MRKCKCGRNFIPSSGHRKCPSCRRRDSKNRCICGRMKNKESARCIKCNNGLKEGSPSWKGGRSYTKSGYVVIYFGKRKYRFEHVLVMEKKLGRSLLEGENVHHKNGVKDDNRIKNLELWIRPQPTGIRAKDALKWAEEIVSLYKPIKNMI